MPEEETWKCVRVAMDIGTTKDEIRVEVLTYGDLLAENAGHEDFARDIVNRVSAGAAYDDSDPDGGLLVYYFPFKKLVLDGRHYTRHHPDYCGCPWHLPRD